MRSLRGGKIAQEESGLLGCLNGDVAPLCGSELRKTNRVSLILIVHLILVDFELVLSQSTFVGCSIVTDHLQVTLGPISELLIQTLFSGSSENL